MEKIENLPKGALSMFYHLAFDESIREMFKLDPTEVMDLFSLSPEAQELIKSSGDDIGEGTVNPIGNLISQEIIEKSKNHRKI